MAEAAAASAPDRIVELGTPDPEATAAKVPEAEEPKKELSKCAYAGYYFLLFWAYWFGANRFDFDGDGDFDPSDVQAYIEAKWTLSRNKKAKVKRSASKAKEELTQEEKKPAEEPESEESKKADRCSGILDRDGDGDVDLDDLIRNQVEGGEGNAQEEEALEEFMSGQARPLFLTMLVLSTMGFWFVMACMYGRDNFLMYRGGLDSLLPGKTNLLIASDECVDFRGQPWRWLSYQFTHLGFSHAFMNTLLNLILGLPLELMHGWWRTGLMFEVGVLGGAFAFFVFASHNSVVGCSGGCYSLMGIHLGDLIMNWSNKKFRLPTIFVLLVLAISELCLYNLAGGDKANKSNSAHAGGAIAGLIIGVLVCKNQTVKLHERFIMVLMFLIGAGLTVFSLGWLYGQQGGPLNIWEAMAGEHGYCWIRAVQERAWDDYQCVQCGTQACIDEYLGAADIMRVDIDWCNEREWLYKEA